MELPKVSIIHENIASLAARLKSVPSEEIAVEQVAGRILAEPLLADRDSPALSVSAMDGYAIRLQDLSEGPLPVIATTPAGSPPVDLPPQAAVRIFTGAPVPAQADCVVKREDTLEQQDQVQLKIPLDELRSGQNIRVQGENTARGETILPAGTLLDSAAMAAVASFGPATIRVRRRLRISILNTGDELAEAGTPVEDWQIRDSNGPVLESWLASLPWVSVLNRRQVGDTLEEVINTLREALAEADAIVLTGGVSMGDADYVPAAIASLGGEIIFHRLPIRPGRPILGACIGRQLVLGLPGNPVSVAVTSRVFGLPLFKACAGVDSSSHRVPYVELAEPDDRSLHLIWYRLVHLDAMGRMRLSPSKGSGDLVSLARSDGFVEIPPGQTGPGPWPLFRW